MIHYYSKVYGSEYDLPLQGTHDHNVPCAVCCVSTRPTVLMIPAKASCPPNWTREYYGYIMTEFKGVHSSDFVVTPCLSVWIKIRSPCLVVMLILMEQFSIT